jgi:hypothetical protein
MQAFHHMTQSLFDSGIRYPNNSMAEDYAFAELALKMGATYVWSSPYILLLLRRSNH